MATTKKTSTKTTVKTNEDIENAVVTEKEAEDTTKVVEEAVKETVAEAVKEAMKEVVKDTVEEIVELIRKNAVNVKKDLVEDALHTMACKKAIKGNRELGVKEMEVLVEKVVNMKDINTCPHGRPIMVKMSKYSLEKQSKRIV